MRQKIDLEVFIANPTDDIPENVSAEASEYYKRFTYMFGSGYKITKVAEGVFQMSPTGVVSQYPKNGFFLKTDEVSFNSYHQNIKY